MVICGGLAAQLTTAAFLLLYSKHTSSFPASPYLFLLLECSAITFHEGFPGSLAVKNPPANAGDTGLIPGPWRTPGGGHGTPLPYPCLQNSMDRGALWATVHRIGSQRVGRDWSNLATHRENILSVKVNGTIWPPEDVNEMLGSLKESLVF